MKINNPDNDDDELIASLAEQLIKFDKPFLIVVDLDDQHLKVVGNTDKFESGFLNMANALRAIADDFIRKHNKLTNDIASSMANED